MQPMPITQQITDFVKSFEGFKARSYPDIGGVWTVGYGTTEGVQAGMCITEAEAEDFLHRDLMQTVAAIAPLIHVPLTENEWCALISFTYNVGSQAFAHSTLLKLLNSGDKSGAAEQLLAWDHVHGVVVPGLLERRKKESEIFLTPFSSDSLHP